MSTDDAAAIAGQREEGYRFALFLLLVVKIQQRVEWQGQTGGTLRAATDDDMCYGKLRK